MYIQNDEASISSYCQQQLENQNAATFRSVKMVDFVKSLYRKFKLLKNLSSQEQDLFQLQIIKLLMNQNEEVDSQNYNLLISKIGLQMFVLEILGEIIKRKDDNKSSKKLQRDIKDIHEILQSKSEQINRKEKRMVEKQNRLKASELNLMQRIRIQGQKYQKQLFENINKKEIDLMKRVTNQLRSLKLKQEIIRQKVNEYKIYESKRESVQINEKKIKQRMKYIQKKQEQIKKRQLQFIKKQNDLKRQIQKKQIESQQKNKQIQICKLQINKYKQKNQQILKKIMHLQKNIQNLHQNHAQKQKIIQNLNQKNSHLRTHITSIQKQLEITKIQLQSKKSPLQQLNISQIHIKHQDHQLQEQDQVPTSLMSKSKITKYSTNQHIHSSIDAIQILIENFLQQYLYDKNLKQIMLKILQYIFENNIAANYKNILKSSIKLAQTQQGCYFNNVVGNFILNSNSTFYEIILILFTNTDRQKIIWCLQNLQLQSDAQKFEMIRQGYLSHLIQLIGYGNIFDVQINNTFILVILRLIQRSQCYEQIMSILSQQYYLAYMQQLFQRYQMQSQIIQNLLVLISRITIFKGQVQFKDQFIKRLRMKMKIINDQESMMAMTIKSILQNCHK